MTMLFTGYIVEPQNNKHIGISIIESFTLLEAKCIATELAGELESVLYTEVSFFQSDLYIRDLTMHMCYKCDGFTETAECSKIFAHFLL